VFLPAALQKQQPPAAALTFGTATTQQAGGKGKDEEN